MQFRFALLPLLLSALPAVSPAPVASPNASTIVMLRVGSRPVVIQYLPLLSNRTDSLALNPNTPRNLMTTLYTPRNAHDPCKKSTISYMPPLTEKFEETALASLGPLGLAPPTFSLLRSENCTIPRSAYSTCPSPDRVLFFSTGFGSTRHFYSATLSSIASSTNSLILALDHPHDADFVEYPPELNIPPAFGRNTTLPDGTPNTTYARQCVVERVKDENHALSSLPSLLLSAGWERSCVSSVSKLVRKNGVGLFGHSLGGATALAAIETDKAFRAGMDWDGSFLFGPGVQFKGSKKPFELLLQPGHTFLLPPGQTDNATTPILRDETYNATWPLLTGYKRVETINKTTHLSFFDGPVVMEALGAREKVGKELIDQFVGEVGGKEMLEILSKRVGGFFGRFL